MAKRTSEPRFLLCINNDNYPVSLEVRKLYRELSDPAAAAMGFVRVIDESGEDYLYPAEQFVPVDLSQTAMEAILAAS